MLKYLIPLCLLATPCFAQQQTPSDVALQINGVIGTWAQMIVQQGKMIEDLQKKLAASEARVKELEPKGQ